MEYETKSAEAFEYPWDITGVANGVYFAQIEVDKNLAGGKKQKINKI